MHRLAKTCNMALAYSKNCFYCLSCIALLYVEFQIRDGARRLTVGHEKQCEENHQLIPEEFSSRLLKACKQFGARFMTCHSLPWSVLFTGVMKAIGTAIEDALSSLFVLKRMSAALYTGLDSVNLNSIDNARDSNESGVLPHLSSSNWSRKINCSAKHKTFTALTRNLLRVPTTKPWILILECSVWEHLRDSWCLPQPSREDLESCNNL